jgi:hypothetical protein
MAMKLLGPLCILLALLLPFPAQAAPQTGLWQVYTVASGLPDNLITQIAPDGRAGVWAGTLAGGRGFPHYGGLAYLGYNGSGRLISDEALTACPSVLGLAAGASDTLWLRLGGYHDYNSADYHGTCVPRYGAAIGFIGEDGGLHMLPKEQLPPAITAGPITDHISRPWFGTANGVVVREHDGIWRSIAIWSQEEGATSTLRAFAFGHGIAVGSEQGTVVTIALPDGMPEQVVRLPQLPADAGAAVQDLAVGPNGVVGIFNSRLFQQNIPAGRWDLLPLPDETGGAHVLTFVGNTLWIGAHASGAREGERGGLYRLDAGGWTAIRAGDTPLPDDTIHDLAALGASLYVATDAGVARLDTSSPTPDSNEAQRAFDDLWRRTNRTANGSWIWGPRPWADRYEPNHESPGGYRSVRYYDKTRMELSLTGENPDSLWYVTNGLLVVEMVTGRAQYGADAGVGGCPRYTPRPCPAMIPVVGDLLDNDSPTYSAFEPLLPAAPRRVGERVDAVFGGSVEVSLATAQTTIVMYDETTGHNVPRIFWDFMRRQPVEWLYTFGHPITEASWTRARVGGSERWVLVQLFERRTLTYNPDNPPPWQVEMGNVGQHYFRWRYGEPAGQLWTGT